MPARPRPVALSVTVEATDLQCDLIADALYAAAELRRRAGLRASEELEAERLTSDRDTRTEAQRIVRTLAEASVLDRIAAAFRAAVHGEEAAPAIVGRLAGDPPGPEPVVASASATPVFTGDEPGDKMTSWTPGPEAAREALALEEAAALTALTALTDAERERLALAEAEVK